MENKKYKIIKDCFVGKVGETIEVDWEAYDGASWHNLDTNKGGNPFIETDCVEEAN